MSHVRPDLELHKRKRDPDDSDTQLDHGDRIPQSLPLQPGNHEAPINYLSRANATRLRLIKADADLFSDVLELIDDYEGVLSRQESLAANLGAKLTGPRLLKAMEGVFEGPISLSPQVPPAQPPPITWLDIVEFSKAQPAEFVLSNASERGRVCQFFLKGYRVEISEEDWRLVVSGALDRFGLLSPHPVDEDETAEVATVEILEQGLLTLIRRADEVARRARQLNYHLGRRRASITARRLPHLARANGEAAHAADELHRPGSGGHPGTYDIHADLLAQFLAVAPVSGLSSRRGSRPIYPSSPLTPLSSANTMRPHIHAQPHHGSLQNSRPSPIAPSESSGERLFDDPAGVHRQLIQKRIEKVERGEAIYPPCDRCRRLKLQCLKHLTACQGCTKKHAKCSWKAVTDEEAAAMRAEMLERRGRHADIDGEAALMASSSSGSSNSIRRSDPAGLPLPGPTRDLAGQAPLPERNHRPTEYASPAGYRFAHDESPTMDVRDGPDGMLMRENEHLRRAQDQHSLLSHMATVATAEAEAREARAVASRGSSSTSHEMSHE